MFATPNPLITAIMPTTASRLRYLPGAFRCFLSQTYENKELVIVSEDSIEAHIPDHPAIRFVKIDGPATVGHKRNVACENAAGEVVVHWDDDDWSAPERMATQLAVLKRFDVPVTGFNSMCFSQEWDGKLMRYSNDDREYATGTSLMYLRGYWRSHRFENLNLAEDTRFTHAIPKGKIVAIDGTKLCVARDHKENTSPREFKLLGEFWQEVEDDSIKALLAVPKSRIVLSLLTWNTVDISLDSLAALKKEQQRFRQLGHECLIVVVDNGSTDGLAEALKPQKGEGVKVLLNKTNKGSSIARNQIIKESQKWRADMLVFMDGDIEAPRWMLYSMCEYLAANPNVHHVGAWSESYTDQRHLTTPFVTTLKGLRIEPNTDIAWTQLGAFKMSCFERCQFPTQGVFGGPFWGWEDGWLQEEFNEHGIVNHVFHGVRYLHRHAHHSVREGDKAGVDMRSTYNEAKKLFTERFPHRAEVYSDYQLPEDHFRER